MALRTSALFMAALASACVATSGPPASRDAEVIVLAPIYVIGSTELVAEDTPDPNAVVLDPIVVTGTPSEPDWRQPLIVPPPPVPAWRS